MLETEVERMNMIKIYEKYKPLMLSIAMKILKNKEQAEDAVHEAFLAIINHKEKYLQNKCPDLGVPIVIIIRNKCFDILKRASTKVENIDDHEHNLESDEISHDSIIIQKEEYELLRKHLSKLDEGSKNILEMRYVLEMSHKEIAEITGFSLESINKKIVRAKDRVRKLYSEGCEQWWMKNS